MAYITMSTGERVRVDEDVYEWAKDLSWHLSKGYASHTVTVERRPKRRYAHVYLHTILTHCPPHLRTDHINQNPLDCRRENLRIVTHAGNLLNNSGRGVEQMPGGKWRARLFVGGGRQHLGTYDTEEEALEVVRRTKEQIVARERN